MEQNLNTGGKLDSLTAGARLLTQRLGISPAPRQLDSYEIGLLQQAKRELAALSFGLAGRRPLAV
jgi:hypothetical protein